MKVTFIHHSAVSVQIDDLTMIFDYTEGVLPKVSETQKVIFFISHHHPDHFSRKIFTNPYQRVTYVGAKDVWIQKEPHAYVMGLEDTLVLDDLTIHTIPSTDCGSAFIVTYHGKRIFHAGDYNYWKWEPENAQEVQELRAMKQAFLKQLPKVAGQYDIAFFPCDPRLKEDIPEGLLRFMEETGNSPILPIHAWNDFNYLSQVKERLKTPERFLLVTHDNETILL